MREQSDQVVCAVATANGFAMPFRPADSTAKTEIKRKGASSSLVNCPTAEDSPLRDGD
jgi:hypothetical protein